MRGYSVRQKAWQDPNTGEYRLSSKYSVYFRDHHGRQRSIVIGSEPLAHRFGVQVVYLVESRRFNERPNVHTLAWLRSLPDAALRSLDRMDLLRDSGIACHTLLERLPEYIKYRESRGYSRRNRDADFMRISEAIEYLGAQTWSQVTRQDVEAFYAHLRSSRMVNGALRSPNTIVKYQRAFAAFGDFVSPEDNVVRSVPMDQEVPASPRRPISNSEIVKLFEFLQSGKARTYPHATPRKRYLLYRLALCTGMRILELKSIRSFDLDQKESTAFLAARCAKNRKDATFLLPRQLTDDLVAFDNEMGKSQERALLRIHPSYKAAEYLRKDMEDAGIALSAKDKKEVVFHSFRYSFVTAVNSAEISRPMQLALARHRESDVNMGYTKFGGDVMRKAWESLEGVV